MKKEEDLESDSCHVYFVKEFVSYRQESQFKSFEVNFAF